MRVLFLALVLSLSPALAQMGAPLCIQTGALSGASSGPILSASLSPCSYWELVIFQSTAVSITAVVEGARPLPEAPNTPAATWTSLSWAGGDNTSVSTAFTNAISRWSGVAPFIRVTTTGASSQTSYVLRGWPSAGPGMAAPISTWSCSLDNIGATLTQCQAAPAAGQALYITDIIAESTTSVPGLMLLRQGTGSNCATGTASVLPAAATVPRIVYPLQLRLATPLKLTAASALCVIGTAVNTLTITVSGYAGTP